MTTRGPKEVVPATLCRAAPAGGRIVDPASRALEPAKELSARALRGSAWTIGGHAVGQVIRFANNLALTYLIDPQLIGLMGIVSVFLAGLQLMSDFGVGPALIQSQHGEERRFQDTAWTLHVVRGTVLWLVTFPLGPLLACIYAGQPGAERLAWLVPAVGTTALVAGFHSTAVYSQNRRLNLRPVVILDVGSQLAGCVVGLACAWLAPGLWALVAGVLVYQFVYTLGSLALGTRNRLRWDREAVRTVARFGRWIWLSTMLTWAALQIDRLVLPKLLRFDGLAIYQVALMIAAAVPETVHLVGSRILFPLLSDLVRHRQPSLFARLWQARLLILLPAAGALVLMGLLGEPLVHLLYPGRFHDAGWMLRLLAAAAIPQTLTASSWYAFFALGRSFVPMCLQAARLVLKCGAMVCGYHLGGTRGVIIGLVAAEAAHYPLVAVALRRQGLFQPGLDAPVLLGSAAVFALGFWIG